MPKKTCGIFLVDNELRLLVAHPTNSRPERWSIPKGRPKRGESYLHAAIRETYEETNVRIAPDVVHHELAHREGTTHLLIPFLVLEKENPGLDWGNFDLRCRSKTRHGFYEMDDFRWILLERAKEELWGTQHSCLEEIESILARLSAG